MRWSVTLLAWWLSAGCASGEGQSQAGVVQQTVARPTIRDSSGVRIVEYPTLGAAIASNNGRPVNPTGLQLDQLPPALRIAKAPFLDLGGLKSDSLLEFDARNPVLSTITFSNGTIVANDRTRIMYFSADGRFLRASGRAGWGPGEFSQTRDLCLLTGDRVMVINFGDQRISIFDAEGRLVRAASRPGKMLDRACTPEGDIVVRDAGMTHEMSDSVDFLVPYRIVRLDGATVSSLGLWPDKALRMVSTTPSVVVDTDEIFVGNGRTFEIKVYDRALKLKRITRLLRLPPPITDLEWKTRLEERERPMGSPEAIARFKRNFLAGKPLRYPSFSLVRVDPAHRLWVSDYQSSGWTVFDRDGLLLGRFNLLGSLEQRRELAGFGPDYVVIRYRDSDGALHLAFHRILQ